MRGRRYIVLIRWRFGIPPPGIKAGIRLTVMGQYLTERMGDRSVVVDCLTINTKPMNMKRALTNLLKKYALTFSEYDAQAAKGVPLPSARAVRVPRRKGPLPARVHDGSPGVPNPTDDRDWPSPDPGAGRTSGNAGLPVRPAGSQDAGSRPDDGAETTIDWFEYTETSPDNIR